MDDFEARRKHLVRLAYQMLGSVSDADDIAQETWIRWQGADQSAISNASAWLTKTATNLAIDRLRQLQRSREEYIGEWLPEPLLDSDPGERAEIDESVSIALMRTLQNLRPEERAAFLLHDVFGYAFVDVASILDLRSAHCRQLASRARARLAVDRSPTRARVSDVERLTDAFFRAIETADLSALESVLADDVMLHSDGGGKAAAARKPIEGRSAVARFFDRIYRAHEGPIRRRSSWFNSAPGALVFEGDSPVTAFQFDCIDGQITTIYAQRNPDKLSVIAPSLDS
ncbi:MAG: RNA polymerase sigma factor SigJ [Planctomycetota bacterium]